MAFLKISIPRRYRYRKRLRSSSTKLHRSTFTARKSSFSRANFSRRISATQTRDYVRFHKFFISSNGPAVSFSRSFRNSAKRSLFSLSWHVRKSRSRRFYSNQIIINAWRTRAAYSRQRPTFFLVSY